MVLDKREPAVYVTIQDASYVAPELESGRLVFGVTLCEKGPHNVLRKVSSKSDFHTIYGEPNYKRTSNVHYQLDNALNSAPILICRVVPEDSTISNAIIKETGDSTQVQHVYYFENENNVVRSTNEDGINAINIGEWIYAEHDSATVAGQVVSKQVDDDSNDYNLILAYPYDGTTTADLPSFGSSGCSLYKFSPYQVDSSTTIQNENNISSVDPDICYNFYAVGAGTYYNNLIIRATRNTQFEKMYTTDDENSDILYPYTFMDIAIYEAKTDGSEKLLEGPWTVSLIPRTPRNELIRDISSGRFLFIENVINESSKYIRCTSSLGVEKLIQSPDAEQRRMQIMSMFSHSSMISSKIVGTGIGVNLENGSYGEGLYDSGGNINPSEEVYGLIARAYDGTLASTDSSIEQLQEYVYPFVQPDYIVSGGYPSYVQERARFIADLRQDCHHLADTGHKVSVDSDLQARLEEYPWNNFTSSLYPQFRKIFDPYTGNTIWMSPIFNNIENQLRTDDQYFIGEPVAGIEKGSIPQQAELAYYANHTQRGDMLDKQLNFTIREPQGQYFSTAKTTYKRMSVLQNQSVAKFVAYIRKNIPPLLKDILQRKGTQFWIEQARSRTYNFLENFVENPSNERYSILKTFSADVNFDDVRQELNLYVNITPLRTIERINVFIIVH